MADGIFPSLVSKDRAVNAATNPIWVELSDGSSAVTVTGGKLDVNASVVLAASLVDDSAFAIATDEVLGSGFLADETTPDSVDEGDIGLARMTLDRKQLVVLVDKTTDANRLVIDNNGYITVNDATLAEAIWADGDNAGPGATGIAALFVAQEAADPLMLLNEQDFAYPRMTLDRRLFGATDYYDDSAYTPGAFYTNASGFLADETAPDSVDEGDIGTARMTLDRKQLIVITDPTTDSQRLAIDATGKIGVSSMPTVTVTATDLDIRNLNLTDDAVKVSRNTTANSETNPIYVAEVKASVSGQEVHSYDTTSAVASDTPDNHDYTVVGTTFFLKSVIIAASGAMKAEIQTGPLASLVTKAVSFLNNRQGDTKQVFFDPPIEVPSTSTGTIRVIRTNREGGPQDVYSTIIGYDV